MCNRHWRFVLYLSFWLRSHRKFLEKHNLNRSKEVDAISLKRPTLPPMFTVSASHALTKVIFDYTKYGGGQWPGERMFVGRMVDIAHG